MSNRNLKESLLEGKLIGKTGVRILRKALSTKKKVATGKTRKSIRYSVNSSFSVFSLSFYANESFLHILRGRKAGGKMPPEKEIIAWIKARNIRGRKANGRFMSIKTLAYLIRRKIARDGIPPTDIMSEFKLFISSVAFKRFSRAMGKDVRNQMIRGVKPLVDNPSALRYVS